LRRAVICVLVLAGLLLAVRTALTGVGKWLVVEDPLRPAIAIAVLGGKMPFRAMGAAELYRAGYAREIWLPGPEGAAEHDPIKKMGFSPYEPDLCYKVLERMGVPRRAVRILNPLGVRNTREEMATISQMLRRAGGGRVIVVTSPTHTRRVRAIWSRVAWPMDELVVRYTRHEPRELKLERWWEREEEKGIVVRELGGLMDTWGGFPMVLVGR
jgi:uncharacterized SAM-binding protein YcdF (DUF218 family)